MGTTPRMSRQLLHGYALLAVLVVGCRSQETPLDEATVRARLERGQRLVDATLGGAKVRYLGFEVVPEGKAALGAQVSVRHYLLASGPTEGDYRLFVHPLVAGARHRVQHADVSPRQRSSTWRAGEIVVIDHALELPAMLPDDHVELRVGLFRGDARLGVDEPRHHVGDDRIVAGAFAVDSPPVRRACWVAVERTAPIQIDGRVTEAEWGGATWSEPFVTPVRGEPSVPRARVRFAWDERQLYAAFDIVDESLTSPDTTRDAPLYRADAAELFIDPTGEGRRYVELQVSPRGVLMDAAFDGGPRANMRLDYASGATVAAVVDGTIDSQTDRDRGYTVELAIPLASLRGGQAAGVRGERVWVNAFRTSTDEGPRGSGRLEQAWVAPLQGDFHNLERFAELWFVGAAETVGSRCSP